MVQDYWQDSGAAKTAPFTLKKGASLRDFTTAAVDGKIIWYQPDGSIRAIQQYRDGAPASRLNYYHNGRLAIQGELPPDVAEPDDPYRSAGEADKGIRYYYENGQLLALDYGHRVLNCYNGCKSWNILYDENGQPLAAGHGTRNGCLIDSDHWNSLNHTPADQQAARRQTFDAALARKAMLEQLLRDSGDINPAIKPPFAADAGNKPVPDTPASQPPAPAGAERGGDNPQTAEANSEPALAITAELPPPPWAGTHEKCERIFCGNRRRGGVGAANNPRSDNIQNKSQTEPAAGNADAPPISMESLPAPPALPVQPLPEDILDAKQAAYNPIDYTPLLPPATTAPLYARYDGKPVKGSAPGGYYRKTLGNTADGRRVVQDYYQDSDTPQTAPFTLKKDANPRDFTTGAVDGKIVWYRKDGSIRAIQRYKNGEAVSPLYTYHEGRLAVTTPQPGLPFDDLYNSAGEISRGLRYYHENGQILALERHILPCNGYCERWLNLYDEQGQPLFAETFEKHGCIMDRHYWNALNDLPADQQIARKKALDAARDRYHTLQQMRHDDGL